MDLLIIKRLNINNIIKIVNMRSIKNKEWIVINVEEQYFRRR